jgi:Skp family chaperone for outer membrane proteins
MKIIRSTPAILFVVVMTAIAAYAQGATRPAGQTAPASTDAVPASKIALVNTNVFYDDKDGIIRLNKALESVEREFEPIKTALQNTQNDMTKRNDDLQKQAALLGQPNSPVNEADLRAKAAALADTKKDFDRKMQDAQDNYKRRLAEAQAPIIEDIVKSLDAYAKQRGITFTLDVAKLPEGSFLTVLPTADITDAFIKDYNSRNPATASIAKPK